MGEFLDKDLEKFSDENFNVNEWINDYFTKKSQTVSNQQHAVSLILNLQLHIQKLNKIIQIVATDLNDKLPNFKKEINTIESQSQLVRCELNNMKDSIDEMKSTRVSLNEINRVNVISDKLNDMSLSLEIDSQWDKLIVQSQEIMNSKNLQNISSLLRNMENLLNSIKDKNAQHKKKNEHIQYLYGQFCEIAENKTIECLSLHDHEEIINIIQIYNNCYQLEKFLLVYARIKKSELKHEIQKVCINLKKIDTIYDCIKTFVDSEVSYIPVENVATCVCIENIVENIFDYINNSNLIKIPINISLEKLIKNIHCTNSLINYLIIKLKRSRDSTKLSSQIYKPFNEIFLNFESMLINWFTDKFDNIIMDSHDSSKCIDVIEQSTNQILLISNELWKNVNLISGYQFAGYFSNAFRIFINKYICELEGILKRYYLSIVDILNESNYQYYFKIALIVNFVDRFNTDINTFMDSLCQSDNDQESKLHSNIFKKYIQSLDLNQPNAATAFIRINRLINKFYEFCLTVIFDVLSIPINKEFVQINKFEIQCDDEQIYPSCHILNICNYLNHLNVHLEPICKSIKPAKLMEQLLTDENVDRSRNDSFVVYCWIQVVEMFLKKIMQLLSEDNKNAKIFCDSNYFYKYLQDKNVLISLNSIENLKNVLVSKND